MVEGSAMMPESYPFTLALRVLCENGAIETSIRLGPQEEISLVRYSSQGEPEALTAEGSDPYIAECEYFVRCARGEADPAVVSPEGERESIRVALAAERAIVEGRAVSL
jgi:predicted dehydrogenase